MAEKESKPKSKIRLWAGRHNRLVTLFGAAIVFVTFIWKEEITEQQKEFIDSLESAISVYQIRTDLQDLERSEKQPPGDIYFMATADYRRTLDLYGKMDRSESVESLLKTVNSDFAQYLDAKSPGHDSIIAQVDPIRDSVAQLQAMVFGRAYQQLQHYEHDYKKDTRISYALYGFGWLLGLVGRLCGVKGLGGDE